MEHYLNTFERFILESLSLIPTSLDKLEAQTGVKQNIIRKVLKTLCDKKLATNTEQYFALDENIQMQLAEKYCKKRHRIHEIVDIVGQAIEANQMQSLGNFRLKKVFLSKQQLIGMKGLFASLESLIRQAEDQQDVATKDKTLIYFGYSNYSDVINFQTQKDIL
ncbi:MAG: hypothetical protein JNM93_01995 [Bacteriovoracaceae bacterium]|nr:hypothetical protein [Bacteriovoracaceae bacterium]